MKRSKPDLVRHMDEWTQTLIHAVHRADAGQKGPFKDDGEHAAYMFQVKRELWRFYEATRDALK